MRFCVLACAFVVLFSSVGYSQGLQAAAKEDGRELRSYTLKVTEVQFKADAKADVNVKELPQKWKDLEQAGKLGLVESVTLSVLEGYEMKAQFGKRTSIVVGRAGMSPSARNPQAAEAKGTVVTRDTQVGTVVKVKVEDQGSKIGVVFAYEAARLQANPKSEVGQDDVITNSIEATFMLEPGKPILASGSNAETGSYIIVSIE